MYHSVKMPGRWALVSSLAIVLVAPAIATAKEKRHGNVVVENKTGKVIEFVTVAHKYSDNYKQAKTWGNLPNGQTVKEPLVVEYNTGFGTTGRDWWVVTWKFRGENAIQLTTPNNFRGLVDALERAAINALPGAGTARGRRDRRRAGGGDRGSRRGPNRETVLEHRIDRWIQAAYSA
jgi:hypothetical protein